MSQHVDNDEGDEDVLSGIASDDTGPLERVSAAAQARDFAACMRA